MTEPKHARSYMPASFIHAAARPVPARGIGLAVVNTPGVISLKGQADDTVFLQAVSQVLGLEPPTKPRAIAFGRQRALVWAAPGECLILTEYAETAALVAQLQAATAHCFAQVIDQSSGYTALWLDGQDRKTVIRHLTAFNIEAMPTQSSAGTVLAHTRVLLIHPGIPCLLVLAGRSNAEWLLTQLNNAARPYGFLLHPAA